MKDDFLRITNHNELAIFLGFTYYRDLAKIIYPKNNASKYHQFQIPKKNGGNRKIASPSRKLKEIQSSLKNVFYEIYPTKPSTHGFAKGRSIITNAEKHLDKKYIFNIDLSDFFGSIHFGRIRNLFKSSPFNFNQSVATILAQICCFDNTLPQGAPTSPILSNMIAWKLDAQLQHLAKNTNCTYTRYADDISFSFTCNKQRLPESIVILKNNEDLPGLILNRIIEENGFKINLGKVRLCSKLSRMEVTGLTVNQFPNVKRSYVRQLSSMLHSWREHGYELAAKEHAEKYGFKHRCSKKPKSYLHVIKGKLAFLRSVRSGRDPLFNKLATQFNNLVEDMHKFKILETSDPEQNAIDALWVIEVCYDDDNGEPQVSQGSAFQLENIGIITCAHVVSEKKTVYTGIEAFKISNTTMKYRVNVDRICFDRDVAICSITFDDNQPDHSKTFIEKSVMPIRTQENVKLLGFPGFAPGHEHYIVDSKVAQFYVHGAIDKFEISDQIREGNSGGPIINENSEVVGIATEGAHKDGGKNGCLMISEIASILTDDNCKA